MKVVITDACIFFDIIEYYFTARFFSLDLEIHTTSYVLGEISKEQMEILSEYINTGKLIINYFTPDQNEKIKSLGFPKGLSLADKSVLSTAQELNASVLSSDKLVRDSARKNSIQYHGLLWIIDRLIENGSLPSNEALIKLNELKENPFYRNRAELLSEIQIRIKNLESL